RPSRASRCAASCLKCSQQGIVLPGTAIQDPIDEEGRSALHATTFAAFHILLDAGKPALFGHVTCVLLEIQTNCLGKLGQVRILKSMLVMEDSIMHLPEFPLRRSALGSESRVERVRMNLDEREVAIDKAQLVPEFLLQGSHHMSRLARIGAFVVAILHQRDRST